MSDSSKVLASFCVKCYNNREYIGEALDGAFSQTYRPLEIVISDDCSTDGSAELIEYKIAEFKANGGDIPVIFNRNKKNLGNIGSWLVFGGIAHGELLIKADGDDISLPGRTEKIVEAWIANGKMAMVIDHKASIMNSSGVDTGLRCGILGAAQAYSRKCWDAFRAKGEMPPQIWLGDDTVFSIRAHALAGAERFQLLMDDALVRYRWGSGSTTSHKKYREKFDSHTTDCIMYALRDIELNTGFLEMENVSATRALCLRRFREAELNWRLARGRSTIERLKAAKSLRNEFGYVSLRDTFYQLLLSLPPMLTDPILDLYLSCKNNL